MKKVQFLSIAWENGITYDCRQFFINIVEFLQQRHIALFYRFVKLTVHRLTHSRKKKQLKVLLVPLNETQLSKTSLLPISSRFYLNPMRLFRLLPEKVRNSEIPTCILERNKTDAQMEQVNHTHKMLDKKLSRCCNSNTDKKNNALQLFDAQ